MSDLIDRKIAVQGIRELFSLGECYCDELSIVGLLNGLPSAEPDRKWIPVTEALPKDMDRLLATIVRSDGSKRVRSGHYYKGLFMMDNGDTWNATDKEVLAWMPIPEAYQGERDGNTI